VRRGLCSVNQKREEGLRQQRSPFAEEGHSTGKKAAPGRSICLPGPAAHGQTPVTYRAVGLAHRNKLIKRSTLQLEEERGKH